MQTSGAVMTITIALTTVGCATADGVVYTSVNDSPRVLKPRTAESVDVYFDKPPTRVHVDVGVFEIYQGQMDDGTGHSTGEMFQTLRLHGLPVGCFRTGSPEGSLTARGSPKPRTPHSDPE